MRQGVSGGHTNELNGGMSDLFTGLFVGFAFGLLSLCKLSYRCPPQRNALPRRLLPLSLCHPISYLYIPSLSPCSRRV